MFLVSLTLALVAALLFAASVTLQQQAARSTALLVAARDPGSMPVRPWLPVVGLLGLLARNPLWLTGWLLNVAGFLVHATALHLGSIAVVQAVLVIQLMFALLLAAAFYRRRPVARDWGGAAAVCTGVGLLVLLRGAVPQTPGEPGQVGAFVAAAAMVIGVILAVARRTPQHAQIRSAMVAVGSGICFCVTAVAMVMLTDNLARHGLVEGALSWPLPCLVASAVTGAVLVQDAFASGSLPTALTAMTITDPVASAVAGVVLFDATPPSGVATFGGLVGAGCLVVAGVVLLASSPTLHRDHLVVPQAS